MLLNNNIDFLYKKRYIMDSETLEGKEVSNGVSPAIAPRQNRDDFPSIFMDIIKKIPVRKSIWLFIAGLIIFSDIFISGMLTNFDNTLDMNCANTKGTIIQLLFLCLSYILIDLLAEGGIL